MPDSHESEPPVPRNPTAVPVHELIAARWSPRSLDPQATVTRDQLLTVLEAGRWAASFGGTFPVRFVAGLRGDETFEGLRDSLSRGNRAWAPAAGALILGVVATENEKGELTYAMFDMGLATAQLGLQAVALGLISHPMAGFDADTARARFAIPDQFKPTVMIALGHLAGPDVELMDPRQRERDAKERRRPPREEVLFHGSWGTPLA